MIATVKSKSGDTLYTPVQARPATIRDTERQLQSVASKRTTKQLLKDYYFATALAAKRAVPL